MRVFFIHVRYWGGFLICCLGGLIGGLGEAIMRFGRWVASRS